MTQIYQPSNRGRKTAHHHFIRLIDFLERLNALRPLAAVRLTFAATMPLIMLGAFASLLLNFPVPALHTWLDSYIGQSWRTMCAHIVAGTFGIVSLVVLCAVSGNLAKGNGARGIRPAVAIATALASLTVLIAPADADDWMRTFSIGQGLFVALSVAVVSTELFIFLAGISFLRLPIRTLGSDHVVREAMTLIPAGMLTIGVFALSGILLDGVGISDIHAAVSTVFTTPLSGLHDGLALALGYTELSQAIWFFGVHGPNLLYSLEGTVFSPAALANAAAIAEGHEPALIFTKSFFDAFSRIGGSGSTLSLCLAILIASRDGGSRKLCLVALFPALCNVNEPILFGVPIVLNPVYAVPFLLTPLFQVLCAWAATLAGWIPVTIQPVSWTMPVFLSGYIVTGGVSGMIMQVFNLVLGVAIYLPFVILSDRLRVSQSKSAMRNLALAAESNLPSVPERRLIGLSGMTGHLADTLSQELKRALRDNGELFLEYQPQVDATTGTVVGAEALLRWNHASFGLIPPPITVALAEDGDHIGKLGLFVLDKACAERARWLTTVHGDFIISVNVAPRQFMTPGFAQDVLSCIERHGLKPWQIELEITESTVLASRRDIIETLTRLHDEGVRIAIDDFGMGHTSLRYLQTFPITTVKIDRSLTIAPPNDVNDQIVRSIVDLCHSVDATPVIEGVETQEQAARFLAFGCMIFQGYLYSRPLPANECLAFILARNHAGLNSTAAFHQMTE